MSTELEQLPVLIQRAIKTLEKATTAAEVLEAGVQADVAYTAAKKAAQINKFKNAHDTVMAACHKAMGEALVIEARAQCRLADEFDAAQDRGEIQKPGGARNFIVPKKNNESTVEDIGLTRKQVHAARAVRDAEKAKPGIVRKTVEEKLDAGEEPTKADVKRAVNGKGTDKKTKSRKGPVEPRNKTVSADDREKMAIDFFDNNMTIKEIAKKYGCSVQIVKTSIEFERGRHATPIVTPDMLSMTAQQKFDAVIKQTTRKLEIEIEQRVRVENLKFLQKQLDRYNENAHHYERVLTARKKGIMTKAEYKLIWSCLHSDSRNSTSDQKLNMAFNLFTKMEKIVLNEQDSPTTPSDLPKTAEELLKRKAEYQAQRKAERNIKRHANTPAHR